MRKSIDLSPKTTLNVDTSHDDVPPVGRFRQILPQVIACTVKNFLLLDLALTMAMPTLIIPALTGNNPNEPIHIQPEEASWLASVVFIIVPIGSVISGWVTEPIGRKRSFIFTSIPHLIAWILLFNSTTYAHVFWAQIFIGFGQGLMEPPLITYIGEIVEPSLRGVLVGLSGIAGTFGFFIVYLLGSFTEWRNVAFYCFFVPLITLVAVLFIPETPLWLLSKNRTKDAQKSLQWLRGWVPPKSVEKELFELKRHSDFSKTCAACYKEDKKCVHPPASIVEKLRGLLLLSTLKPLTVLLIIYTLSAFTGTQATRPFLILIFKAYGTPISPNNSTVLLGVVGVIGTTTCVCLIKFVGKRKLFLYSLIIVSIPKISLGIYGFINLPFGTTSFYPQDGVEQPEGNYFPLIAFCLMYFFNSVGIGPVPYMLFSELLPYKTRSIATGLAAAVNYFISFLVNKSYYNLEMIFTLPGVIIFYGIMCLIAAVISFFILPETENRSLEDIEIHFSDKNRKFFDRRIQENAAEKNMSNQPIIIGKF